MYIPYLKLFLNLPVKKIAVKSYANIHDSRFYHDIDEYDDIKWKHLSRYWPFARGIHTSSVNSPQKGQWRGALMFSLICVWINGWVNNREAGDLRRYRAHYDVIVMICGPQPIRSFKLGYVTGQGSMSPICVGRVSEPGKIAFIKSEKLDNIAVCLIAF